MLNSRLTRLICLVFFWTFPTCGRPQANPNAKNFEITRNVVVFIYARDAKGTERPDGTGFLLSVPMKSDPSRGYLLLVTARHMADPEWMGCHASADDLLVRFNKEGYRPGTNEVGTAEYPLKDQRWIFPGDDIDIAYTILDGKRVDEMKIANHALKLSELPTANEVASMGIGDPIVSAGLLEGASGTKRNYPIFKFGNISSIPDEKIPVSSGCGAPAKLLAEWLIAASLVPGNSGSPIVFTPALFQAGRTFVLGVQSISIGVQFATFTGTSDVAGMAPIRPLVESIRGLNLVDADLSKPADPTPSTVSSPTSVPIPSSAKPGPLPAPK